MAERRRRLRLALRPEPAAVPEVRIVEARVASLFSQGEAVVWEKLRLELPGGGFKLLLARHASLEKAPAVLLMHQTGGCKESMADALERLARQGLLAVSFDAPHHGERALPEAGLSELSLESLGPAQLRQIRATALERLEVYYQALTRGYRQGGERYVLDICRDALYVVDHLVARPDVEGLGAAGVSLGGMASWLLAACDERVAAAAPAIGVQSFHHALVKGLWQARVDSVRPPFDAAADGKPLDAATVRRVWARIAPGLAEADESMEDAFDGPLTLPLIAPRDLLVINGSKDPRCPLEGVEICIAKAKEAYERLGQAERFGVYIQEGVGHEMTLEMWQRLEAFFVASLKKRKRSQL